MMIDAVFRRELQGLFRTPFAWGMLAVTQFVIAWQFFAQIELFVDLEPDQEAVLQQVLRDHAGIERAGTGTPARHWMVALQQKSGSVRHA